jgi:Tol biopolymer transport system component
MNADGTGVMQITQDNVDHRQPRWSPDGAKIAFAAGSIADRTLDIYIMDADGSHQERLTDTPELELDPAWYPDGTSIAFTREVHGDGFIYLMNADGTHQVRITSGGSSTPAFSPNGTMLALVGPGGGILIVDTATGKAKKVTRGPHDQEPTWSPDGLQIAFRRGVTGPNAEIYVVNADGTGLKQLTHDAQVNLEPAWSPA